MLNPSIPNILKTIVDVKRIEVDRLKKSTPIPILEKLIDEQTEPLDFASSLQGDSMRIIAEIKKASPVKGPLVKNFDPISLAHCYAGNGASAISVLTNFDHFQGTIDHLQLVKKTVSIDRIPVLRKDFIFDEYQIIESRAYGADAALLIVGMLTTDSLNKLMDIGEKYRIHLLVEVHDKQELMIAIDAGARIIGINNRDLRTFETDLKTTERLASFIPTNSILVSESGIRTQSDIQRLRKAGADAVLIGESLVTAKNPGAKLRELL